MVCSDDLPVTFLEIFKNIGTKKLKKCLNLKRNKYSTIYDLVPCAPNDGLLKGQISHKSILAFQTLNESSKLSIKFHIILNPLHITVKKGIKL